MKDLSQDSVEFMDRKFVFTTDVIDFLTKVFRACDFEASGKLSQREMELLFRPIGNYPEEFELSYDMSPVNNHTNSYGAYFQVLPVGLLNLSGRSWDGKWAVKPKLRTDRPLSAS